MYIQVFDVVMYARSFDAKGTPELSGSRYRLLITCLNYAAEALDLYYVDISLLSSPVIIQVIGRTTSSFLLLLLNPSTASSIALLQFHFLKAVS